MRAAKLIFSFLIIGLMLTINNVFAQEKGHEMTPEQKAWMEYMSPGKMHDQFKQEVGTWNYVSKYWMDPSSKEPMVTNGSAKFETLFGGRYLKMVHNGEMMGRPFTGMGITGYDNAKKTYQSIWLDNMGTGIMYMTGNYKDGKMVLVGTAPDPMTGKDVTMKDVTTYKDKDNFLFEMYVVTPDGEIKTMEIDYKRAK